MNLVIKLIHNKTANQNILLLNQYYINISKIAQYALTSYKQWKRGVPCDSPRYNSSTTPTSFIIFFPWARRNVDILSTTVMSVSLLNSDNIC